MKYLIPILLLLTACAPVYDCENTCNQMDTLQGELTSVASEFENAEIVCSECVYAAYHGFRKAKFISQGELYDYVYSSAGGGSVHALSTSFCLKSYEENQVYDDITQRFCDGMSYVRYDGGEIIENKTAEERAACHAGKYEQNRTFSFGKTYGADRITVYEQGFDCWNMSP